MGPMMADHVGHPLHASHVAHANLKALKKSQKLFKCERHG
jgi:hypothetical protein